MEYKIFTLPNGIRLVHKQVDSPVAHCGVHINAGSREESEIQQGMAHFIEHVIFKGTIRRKAYHIISRLEDVGGELNAYTTKEDTCIHASFLKDDYPRVVELFSDILFNSLFPEKELEKEKEVIIDEINSYKDTPSELIFDDFDSLVFKSHPLGHPILGTPDHLKSFNKKMIHQFMQENYHTDQMVFSSVGNIEAERLFGLLNEYFGRVKSQGRLLHRKPFRNYQSEKKIMTIDTYQAHCVLGLPALSAKDKRRLGLHLLNNILGGPGMNSRLNMSLREKNGFTYNVESSFQPYHDTGLFSIYFGTDREKLDHTYDLVLKEIKILRDKKLGELQLSKAKRQFIGQLAIASESNETQMLNMGKSLLTYKKIESIEKVYSKINSLSAIELLEIANEVMQPEEFSSVIYK